jgi:hypothetical protein
MTQVLSLDDFRPSPRYDGLPWTEARIEEGTSASGPWALIDTIAITPVDADPSNPASRSFTTQLASDGELWYRIIFADADGDIGQPTFPIQNTLNPRPVYASVSELAAILRVNTGQRHAALLRALESAALEIDSEIGTADKFGNALPYTSPPAVVSTVNLDRAVEHWKQTQAPFGIVGFGDDVAMYVTRDTWDRHAQKLAVLKGTGWGIA